MSESAMMQHGEVASFCAALPGATEDIKWQTERVYSVCNKMFCVMSVDPTRSAGISFKVAAERFLELTDQPGIQPAPYLARYHWIRLNEPGVLPADELRRLLSQSYQLVRAKLAKQQRAALPPLTIESDLP